MPDPNSLAMLMAGGRRRDPYAEKRAYGYKLLQSGADSSPIQSPWQGVSRLAQALAGGFELGMADRDEKAGDAARRKTLAEALAEPDTAKAEAMMVAADPDNGPRLAWASRMQREKLMREQADNRQAALALGPQGGVPQTQGMPPPLPSGQVPPGAAPPGFDNNLGNIRVSGAPWEGKGQPHRGFETFGTPQAGADAAFKNLQAYAQKNPAMTVAQAIATWAPPSENDTQGYIRQLAEATGINPGMPLGEVLKDPAMAATMLDAITRKEKGGLPQGVTADTFMRASGAPTQLGPQAIAAPPPGAAPMPPGAAPPMPNGAPPAPNPAVVGGPTVVAQAPPRAPDIPRPSADPALVQRLQGMVSTGRMKLADAERELNEDINKRWGFAQQQAGEERKSVLAMEAEKRKQQLELEKEGPRKLIGERTKNYEENIRPKAESAVTEINSIHQMRQLLDQGAITGTGADAQVAARKLAQAVGIEWGNDAVANTAALQSAVGQRVLALVKNLGAGSGISNADREYAAKIAGGEISMTNESMRRIMDIGERAARNVLKDHDAQVGRIKKLPGIDQISDDYFGVPVAPTYEEWSKANPPMGAPPTAAPGAPPQGGEPPVVNSPAEAAQLPKGTVFKTPDGRIKVVP